MAFRLRTTRDNRERIYSIQKLLELLGESVNDEIVIDGQAYRISSFEDLGTGTGGSNQLWQNYSFAITQNGQSEFAFNQSYADTESLFLVVNGSLYAYGENKDYHLSEGSLLWHGDFALETTDRMYLKYLKTIK